MAIVCTFAIVHNVRHLQNCSAGPRIPLALFGQVRFRSEYFFLIRRGELTLSLSHLQCAKTKCQVLRFIYESGSVSGP